MQNKYARLINTINSTRSQMYKLAEVKPENTAGNLRGDGNPLEDVGGAEKDDLMQNMDENTNKPSLKDNLRAKYDQGLAYLKDNPEQAIATGVGALGMGAGAYLLAKLLKKKRAWMYGLGGALAGGAAGAFGGQAAYAGGKRAYGAIKEWLDRKRRVRKYGEAAASAGVGIPENDATDAAVSSHTENANPDNGMPPEVRARLGL